MKKAFFVVLAIAMVFSFAACSSPSGSASQSQAESAVAESAVAESAVAESAVAESAVAESAVAESVAEGNVISGWPTSELAKTIPVVTEGAIVNVTSEQSSEFILINGISLDYANNYWQSVQNSGFTNINNESTYTGGWSKVASNNNKISLSVTYSETAKTLTLLVFAL